MSEYQLIANTYAAVTPAGAYYAATVTEDEPARRLLLGMLGAPHTVQLSTERLLEWSGLEAEADALALLHHVQSVRWVCGEATAREAPRMQFEQDMPALLQSLSSQQRALLADAGGLQLASCGFAHESAEQVSALAADLAALHDRYAGLLRGNLRLRAGGIAVVDAAGSGQLGAWPLAIGKQTFLLVVAGAPLFHRQAFADLIWALISRYAPNPQSAASAQPQQPVHALS
jgi:hypothetical protein